MDADKAMSVISLGSRANLIREHVFDLLDFLERETISNIRVDYRMGKTEKLIAHAAKLVALDDLREKILVQLRNADRAKKEMET